MGAVDDAADLARLTGLPLLLEVSGGALDPLGEPDESRGPTINRRQLDAARSICRRLRPLGGNRPPGSLLVCPGIGAASGPTVAISVATAAAIEGRRTLLVDLDFLEAPVATALGLRQRPGIGDYLNTAAAPAEVLQAMELDGPALEPGRRSGRLVIIGAGSGSPTPMPPFTWERFSHFMEKAQRAYDFVVLSGEPLLAESQPCRVMPLADAALVCARAGETTRAEARAACSVLGRWTPPHASLLAAGA